MAELVIGCREQLRLKPIGCFATLSDACVCAKMRLVIIICKKPRTNQDKAVSCRVYKYVGGVLPLLSSSSSRRRLGGSRAAATPDSGHAALPLTSGQSPAPPPACFTQGPEAGKKVDARATALRRQSISSAPPARGHRSPFLLPPPLFLQLESQLFLLLPCLFFFLVSTIPSFADLLGTCGCRLSRQTLRTPGRQPTKKAF
ncbi:hypothetical protein V8C44DRAFT_248573 [Trichoderma aethiopicum]